MAQHLPAHPLPKTDAYVLVGMGWHDLPVSPLTHLVLSHLDTAGEKGAARLHSLSQRMHLVRVPYGKDLTEHHQQGGVLYSWLSCELRLSCDKTSVEGR
ncbi:MAG: hypothetical protein HY866_23880 [Chloroflexi bacterium]|nr:hypothetical protein [Chloroflexota bacterium]